VRFCSDFLECFAEKLNILLRQSFIAQQQSCFYRELKVKLMIVILDFSESYYIIQDGSTRFSLEQRKGKIFKNITYSTDSVGLQNFVEIQDGHVNCCVDLTRNDPHPDFQKFGNYKELQQFSN
jgi:hypothetical protein